MATKPSGDAGLGDSSSNEAGLAAFECNICLETATEPVVTFCGHLYCWPCLYRWMRNGHAVCPVCKAGVTRDTVIPLYGRGNDRADPRSTSVGGGSSAGGGASSTTTAGAPAPTPDASSAASSEAAPATSDASRSGGGGDDEHVPRRPAGQRMEPPPPGHGSGVGFGAPGGGGGGGDGIHITAGIGFFPSLFGLQFQTFGLDPRTRAGGAHAPLTLEEQHQQYLSRVLFMVGCLIIIMLFLL